MASRSAVTREVWPAASRAARICARSSSRISRLFCAMLSRVLSTTEASRRSSLASCPVSTPAARAARCCSACRAVSWSRVRRRPAASRSAICRDTARPRLPGLRSNASRRSAMVRSTRCTDVCVCAMARSVVPSVVTRPRAPFASSNCRFRFAAVVRSPSSASVDCWAAGDSSSRPRRTNWIRRCIGLAIRISGQ